MSRRTGTGAVNRYRTYGTAATGSVRERKTAKYRFRDQRCSAAEKQSCTVEGQQRGIVTYESASTTAVDLL